MFDPLLGSAEGFTQADKAINASSKSGRWVMLKNVHLAPNWLVSLEKKLHSLTPHPNFRLFLTMEINPRVNNTCRSKFYEIRCNIVKKIDVFCKEKSFVGFDFPLTF